MWSNESSHVKKFKKTHLTPGENFIIGASAYLRVTGHIGFIDMSLFNWLLNRGYIFITDKRIVFFRNGYFGDTLEEIPLNKITSIKRRSRLYQRVIRIYSKHTSLEFEVYSSETERLLMSHLNTLTH